MKDYLRDPTIPLPLAAWLNDVQTALSGKPSWYCDQCHVEVYARRCPYCGKTETEKS